MFPEEVAFDVPPNCFLVIAIASDGLAEETFSFIHCQKLAAFYL